MVPVLLRSLDGAAHEPVLNRLQVLVRVALQLAADPQSRTRTIVASGSPRWQSWTQSDRGMRDSESHESDW